MTNYMVLDLVFRDYCVFATEQDARDYIKETLDIHPDLSITDFKLFERKEIAL